MLPAITAALWQVVGKVERCVETGGRAGFPAGGAAAEATGVQGPGGGRPARRRAPARPCLLAAIAPTFTRLFMGKDVVASKTGRIVVPNDGMLGSAVPVTELRVVFRAWSDDDLTESLGQVFQDDDLPAEQVEHMGDQRFSQGDDNYFVS